MEIIDFHNSTDAMRLVVRQVGECVMEITDFHNGTDAMWKAVRQDVARRRLIHYGVYK